MLTNEHKAHFETFGFLVLKNAFSEEEMAKIITAFDQVLLEDRQGEPFSGERRQAVLACIEKHPALTSLSYDDRIYLAIEQLLGEDFIWIGSDGNLYVGDTQWHPDGGSSDLKVIKIAFYLDPARSDTGCLRVIPGSHHEPLHSLIKSNIQKFGVIPEEIPFFPLESDPGDVVLFNQNVWHSSFGGKKGRRMMTLNFGENPVTVKQLDNVKKRYEANLKFIKENSLTKTNRLYEDTFLHHENPRIQSMTSKLRELNLF